MHLKNIFSKINQNKPPKRKSIKTNKNKKGKCFELIPCLGIVIAGVAAAAGG